MSVQVLQPGAVAVPQPISMSGWAKFCDVTETVTYVTILGAGLLTPIVFGLYAVLFR